MLDAEQYYAHVEQILSSCPLLADAPSDSPRIQKVNGEWVLAYWRAIVEFHGGHKLQVLEIHKRSGTNDVTRYFNYHFMDANSHCVFRFDTHGITIPDGNACHFHVGEAEMLVEEGDLWATKIPLREIDFRVVFKYAVMHLKGKPLPWE